MDRSLPVAKRTRSMEAQFLFKEWQARKGVASSSGKKKITTDFEPRADELRVNSKATAEPLHDIKKGVENFDNQVPIYDDDHGSKQDEESDVEILGEGDNCFDSVCINVDEFASSRKRLGENNGVNLDGRKNRENVSVSDNQAVSLDESESSTEDDDELTSSSEEEACESFSEEDESESSSEMDGDNSDAEDFVVDSFEQSKSSRTREGEDGDDSNAMEGSVDGEAKRHLGPVKRRKYGLDILIDLDKEEDEEKDNLDNATQAHTGACVARRTRSHFGSRSTDEEIRLGLGTISHPFCVDEEEDEMLDSFPKQDDCDGVGDESYQNKKKVRSNNHSAWNKKIRLGSIAHPFCVDKEEEEILNSSFVRDDDDDDDNGDDVSDETYQIKRKTRCNNHNNDDEVGQKVGKKDGGESRRTAKRKRLSSLKGYSILKVLGDSIWDKGDVLLEELVEAPNQETNPNLSMHSLALKFRFEVGESNPPEKIENIEEIDQLWGDFDFALRSCEIGSIASSMVDSEESTSSDTEIDQATLCRQGNHCFILDEQIGIICKYCYFVDLEMKYIVPSFGKHPCGRSAKKDFGKMGDTTFDKLQIQNSVCDSQLGSNPCVLTKNTVWDIIPGIKDNMHPHQREGFEFIWKNIAGGIFLDEIKKSTCSPGGSGCVISHAPGTGKTRLTLAFLQTYMEVYPTCHPIIIAPCTMLLSWEEEFRKWKVNIPFHNLNKPEFSGKENVAAVSYVKRAGDDRDMKCVRLVKLLSWNKSKSILGISYDLFKQLVGGEKTGEEGKNVRRSLLELPGLLVLDEGHKPRNDRSRIWKALSRIETERRIILSGTPFQNNFDELYNTFCLVRPKFADSMTSLHIENSEKKRGRKRSVAKGTWASLTSSIGKDADIKLKNLKAMIGPFVHVHKGSILQESLPGLRDSVVFLNPTAFQKRFLDVIQERKNFLEFDNLLSLISVHPSVLLESKKDWLRMNDRDALKRFRLKPDEGVKTKFLIELIRLSDSLNEKVLVFSSFIDPLTFMIDQLKSHFNWDEGKEVLYMDGKIDVKQRQSSINVFNDATSEARVLLASTRACSEGINLVGASRVVLLDVEWNPSVERQAISRAYRLGQKKIVYIYHLIASGTMEVEKYYKQAIKDRLSELVFFSADRDCNGQKNMGTVSDDKILEAMVQHDSLKAIFDKIIYQPKESNLIETFSSIIL